MPPLLLQVFSEMGIPSHKFIQKISDMIQYNINNTWKGNTLYCPYNKKQSLVPQQKCEFCETNMMTLVDFDLIDISQPVI